MKVLLLIATLSMETLNKTKETLNEQVDRVLKTYLRSFILLYKEKEPWMEHLK